MDIIVYPNILFFIVIAGYAMGLMAVFPRLKAGNALLSALCGMLFVSYWGVIILGWMQYSAWMIMLGGLVCFMIAVTLAIVNKCTLRARFCNVSFYLYFVLCILLVVFHHEYQVASHDSLSFWARATKELFTFNSGYMNGNSNISHADYIPLFASLQYAIVHVFGWHDLSLVFVPFVCVITSLLAVADAFSSKPLAALFVLLGMIIYPMYGFVITDITVDGALSILFAGALLILATRRDASFSSLLSVILVIAILPGVKIYSGLLFALVLTGIIASQWSWKKPQAKNSELPVNMDVKLRYPIIALVMLLAIQTSWSGYYHYHSRLGEYQNQKMLYLDYLGQSLPAELSMPSFELKDLAAGNPRSAAFVEAVLPEKYEQVGEMIAETWQMYIRSNLPTALFFAMLLLISMLMKKGYEKAQRKIVLVTLFSSFILYVGGLFAGYFVQAEILGAATNYLRTVSIPFVIAAAFFLAQSIQNSNGWRRVGLYATGATMVLYLVLCTDTIHGMFPRMKTDDITYVTHARSFFEDEVLQELLSQEDENARAIIIDCTWDASEEIKSKSGITHAYQYYALPMRFYVYQFPYGNSDPLEGMTYDFLSNAAIQNRANLLLLRLDDTMYIDAFAEILEVDPYIDMPWVVDIVVKDGQPTFHLRNEE